MIKSSGILLRRNVTADVEFFLVHPGGPFWSKKDEGAWSIPKGLVEAEVDSLAAALREFAEETGYTISGDATFLGSFKQLSGKIIDAWLIEGTVEATTLRGNTFKLEWPSKSGALKEFPEVDRGGWFTPAVANQKIVRGQRPILEAALEHLHHSRPS